LLVRVVLVVRDQRKGKVGTRRRAGIHGGKHEDHWGDAIDASRGGGGRGEGGRRRRREEEGRGKGSGLLSR